MMTRPSSYPRLLIIQVIILLTLTGCASRQVKFTETGFLSGYSGLKEDEASDGMRVYKNFAAIGEKHYSKVLIAPIQFKLNPHPEAHGMDEEDQDKLADYFHEQLREGLAENYTIVDEPGEGVLLLRTAITDVLPNKVYLNLHWSTTLLGAGTGGASLEAELVDSLTGERVMTFVDARKGKRLHYTKGLTKWGHTKEVMGTWASVMALHLDQLSEQ